MKSNIILPLYKKIMPFLSSLTYVDVGARAMKRNRFVETFPCAQYIGFELDAEECQRLNALHIDRHQFYAQALGRNKELRRLYLTRNPACSSFYEPNSKGMHRFMECGPFFDVLEKKTVETISLDDWCRDAGILETEFLELDTQGSELDILQGSKHLLSASVLGLQIEVEFFPMYKDQPLFADVDNYLEPMGFRLFDLSRYRLRRAHLKTRGQLLWGHAFYLKEVQQMNRWHPKCFLALAAIASYYGFEDYALEILAYLIEKKSEIESFEYKEKIQSIVCNYSGSYMRPPQRSIQRLWKKTPNWILSSRKDRGYFIKD